MKEIIKVFVTKYWSVDGISEENATDREGRYLDCRTDREWRYLDCRLGFLILGRDAFLTKDKAIEDLYIRREKLIIAHRKKLAKLDRIIEKNQ